MQISSNFLRDAKKILTRIRYNRAGIPILTHILASVDAQGITLAVSDLDRWLETRTDVPPGPCNPEQFLISLEAMSAATRADRGTKVTFTLRGARKRRELRVVATCGGIAVESSHPTLEVTEFPQHPVIQGEVTTLPGRTFESLCAVAGCASTDETRYVLNGVLFSSAQGGQLIATDGRRLASSPATVLSKDFILPTASVHVLLHPNFGRCDAEVSLHQDGEDIQVAFRSGNHMLVTKTITGNYPSYRQVIPADVPELVTVSGDRRPAVVAWLRALPDRSSAVHLTWEKRGHLTLSQRSASNAAAVLRVAVEIHGKPPVIAFNPRYLADAFEIGSTLCLKDEVTPGVCKHPGGQFCVLMPMQSELSAEEIERNNRQAASQAA